VQALERADALQALGEDDRLKLALTYQALGKFPESRAQLLQLTKAAPKDANYLYLLARLDRQTLDLDQAVSGFRHAIDLDPGMMRAWEELAQCQEAAGRPDEARKTYESAVERNRQQKTPWAGSPLDLGVLRLKAGNLEQAETLIRESLQYDPRLPAGYYYLGQLKQKQGKDPEAVTAYQTAVVHNPLFREAWVALGDTYTHMGMKTEAAQALEKANRLATAAAQPAGPRPAGPR
jgi:tetratricopeptide (TPR) repeat protein